MSRLCLVFVYYCTTTVAYISIVQHVNMVKDDVAVVGVDSIKSSSIYSVF